MFSVQGPGFSVQGSGFSVKGQGFRVQGSVCRVEGLEFRVYVGGGRRAEEALDGGHGLVHRAHERDRRLRKTRKVSWLKPKIFHA